MLTSVVSFVYHKLRRNSSLAIPRPQLAPGGPAPVDPRGRRGGRALRCLTVCRCACGFAYYLHGYLSTGPGTVNVEFRVPLIGLRRTFPVELRVPGRLNAYPLHYVSARVKLLAKVNRPVDFELKLSFLWS